MTPIDLASHLMSFAAQEVEPDYLTQLRLHKLLYYVQGWSLALRDRIAFDDEIQAWKHGPVVASLWPAFTKFGKNPIIELPAPSQSVSYEDRFFLRVIWQAYRGFSPSALWEKTHKERPWLETRGSLPADAKSKAVISRDLMRDFFRNESADAVDFDFKQIPDWITDSDDRFLSAAQSGIIKYATALRKLA